MRQKTVRKPFTVLLSEEEINMLHALADRQGCAAAVEIRILIREKSQEVEGFTGAFRPVPDAETLV
jgi:hypothetical protein